MFNKFRVMLLAPPYSDLTLLEGQKSGHSAESEYGAVVFQALRYLRRGYSFEGIVVPYMDERDPIGNPLVTIEDTDQLILLRLQGWSTSTIIAKVADYAATLCRDEFFLTPYVEDAELRFDLTPTEIVNHDPFDVSEWTSGFLMTSHL